MWHITIPVLIAGLLTTFLLEKFKIFGFGEKLPEVARRIIEGYTKKKMKNVLIKNATDFMYRVFRQFYL